MEQIIKFFKMTIITMLVVQLSGCGTLLYPERRGQKAGHLDVGVVILDTIGLLFFIIPGVIAFCVDFSNGTIYLPATSKVQLKQIKFDPKRTTLVQIEKIIKDETGQSVKLDGSNVRISRLKSKNEIAARFAQTLPEIKASRFALVHQLKGKA